MKNALLMSVAFLVSLAGAAMAQQAVDQQPVVSPSAHAMVPVGANPANCAGQDDGQTTDDVETASSETGITPRGLRVILGLWVLFTVASLFCIAIGESFRLRV